jgi:hypothetical protein
MRTNHASSSVRAPRRPAFRAKPPRRSVDRTPRARSYSKPTDAASISAAATLRVSSAVSHVHSLSPVSRPILRITGDPLSREKVSTTTCFPGLSIVAGIVCDQLAVMSGSSLMRPNLRAPGRPAFRTKPSRRCIDRAHPRRRRMSHRKAPDRSARKYSAFRPAEPHRSGTLRKARSGARLSHNCPMSQVDERLELGRRVGLVAP